MTKKEYILAVIDTMPDWEMGWGIKAMVQNNQLDESTIDKLVIILKKMMHEIATKIREDKMIEKVQAMKNLEKQKQEQAKQDEENLAKLDNLLDNI